jgi:polysaccharide biosynthesis protein PslG
MKLTSSVRARTGILVILGLALILPITLYGSGIAARVLAPVPGATARPTDLGAGLVTKRAFPSLSYGVHTFLWWNQTTRPRDLEMVRLMRFDTVKQLFEWADIQPDPNRPYDWVHADAVVDEARYRGLNMVARIGLPPQWATLPPSDRPDDPPVDLAALGRFCHDLAERYQGRITAYQVWNETNLAREWADRPPSAAGYVKLLKACYEGIKKGDPGAVVITAGLAPTGNDDATAMSDERYLREMYKAGLSPYYDVLGLNAPGYKSPPTLPPDDPSLEGNRWQSFRHVEDMRAIMVANGDGAKQVALLEVGWTTDQRDKIKDGSGKLNDNPYRWHAVTEAQQAEYLVGAYQYAAEHWRPWVGLIVTIYLADPNWTEDREEYWWSIAYGGYDVHTRPAFGALAQMPRYIDDKVIPAVAPGDNHTPLPPPR